MNFFLFYLNMSETIFFHIVFHIVFIIYRTSATETDINSLFDILFDNISHFLSIVNDHEINPLFFI